MFRGPERDLRGPYLTFLGGTAFHGKYVIEAIPDMVEDHTGLACVNLGLLNAGVDAMRRPEVIALANRGRATVIEVVGAQNLNNQFYRVHPERNDRLVCATRLFRQVFPEIDLSEVHFTRHLLQQVRASAPNRYETVVEELRSAWVEGMMGLLRNLTGPKILLWVMPAPPADADQDLRAALGSDPLFVDTAAVQTLSGFVDAVVEVRETPDITARGHVGMVLPETPSRVVDALPRGALLAEAAMSLLEPLHALGFGPGRGPRAVRLANGTDSD